MNTNKIPQSSGQSLIFQKPMPLICKNEAGQLMYNTDAIKELRQIEKPLNIVAVVGILRTGKSTLLNKLANIKSGEGFEIGHSFEAVTKGIWVMCLDHPVQQDQVLVLLDTEGVGDPLKLEQEEDKWLFVLATLLCSTLVYNNRSVFDQTALDRLTFLNVIESSVKLAEGCNNDFLLDFYFPTFVLAMRDFTLNMPSSSDMYLEKILKMKRGETDCDKIYNNHRRLIRRYFPERKCFIFVPPTNFAMISKVMELDEKLLDQGFLTTLKEFKNYVYSLKPKMLKSGKKINGRMFVSLVQSYVNAIKHAQSPCIMEAFQQMIDNENQYVISCAAELYKSKMKNLLAQHVPNDQGLERYHKECMHNAMDSLQKTTVYNDNQIIKKQVMEQFNAHRKEFQRQIDQDSKERCVTRLQFLNKTIERKLKNGEYNVPTGYDDYWNDIDHIITQYKREIPYLGPQARNVLQEFIDSKEKEEQIVYELVSILQAKTDTNQSQSFLATQMKLNMTLDDGHNVGEDIYTEDVDKKVDEMQEISFKSIRFQFTDMMKSKDQEFQKVIEELSLNDPYCRTLHEESKTIEQMYKDNKDDTCPTSYLYKDDTCPTSYRYDAGEQQKQRKIRCVLL